MARQENYHPQSDNLGEEFERLRRFSGPPAQFWPSFLQLAATLVSARCAFLMARSDEGIAWKYLMVWPENNLGVIKNPGVTAKLREIAEAALLKGTASLGSGSLSGILADSQLVAVRLNLDEQKSGVAVFLLDRSANPEETAIRLSLVADTPGVYHLNRVLGQAKSDVGKFSDGLDLTVLLNDQKRFIAASMTFCNEISSRYRCDRVTLGWLKGNYVKLQVISHMERFEKKMDVVQDLEALMEEALDQDEEIVYPRVVDGRTIVRNHESFARKQGSSHLVSIPIRLDGEPVGVLTAERLKESFSETDVRGLRLLCDLAARRLGDLQERDRWIGSRLAAELRQLASRLVGVENTFAKLAAILIAALLAFGIFGKLNYRVEAPFMLKSDDVAHATAPFDGYIDKVNVQAGDRVNEGDLLVTFDKHELLLEESAAIANEVRYEREAEKARAERVSAEMLISNALADEAHARLDLVRYRLQHSEIRAPFAGIIVEGDLKEFRGSPAKKGDVLFKIALTRNMYTELEIDERDVHEFSAGATGEVAFRTRPDVKFPIRIERIDPVAIVKDQKNVFLARAVLTTDIAPWLRPGMSGVSKVSVGRRNVLWILAHRTIDFLRIYFWW